MKSIKGTRSSLLLPWFNGDYGGWNQGRVSLPTTLSLLATVILACFSVSSSRKYDSIIDATVVKNCAVDFGKSITEFSAQMTCEEKIEKSFLDLGAEVEWVDAIKMSEEIRTNIETMLARKKKAVARLAEVAKFAAQGHSYDKELIYEYYNAKKLKEEEETDVTNKTTSEVKVDIKTLDMEPHKTTSEVKVDIKTLDMEPHKTFSHTHVSFQESSIHIPTNVYEKDPYVINAIKWSELLNSTFHLNMAEDPSLNWQYFGSVTGFLRTFPGSIWQKGGKGPDLYDCRSRPWYVQAAASAKDVVILVDGSGSMTGIRKEIARNVIIGILGTLSDNDYVNILRLSDLVEPVVPCFEDTLVQANEENIQEFVDHLDGTKTENIANFSLGLTVAFDLLQQCNYSEEASHCNQAIMLITDGAPSTYEEIFERYNWPDIYVRIFTFLIGREVTDTREVDWMACNNKGYFAHVASLTEVSDEVFRYIPVMSRPIALSGEQPFIWTPVYADVPAYLLNKEDWEENRYDIIRKRLARMRQLLLEAEEEENDYETSVTTPEPTQPPPPQPPKKKTPLQLMTTVATPVFEKRANKLSPANLLGVVGIDVPVKEIQKYASAFKLGVNGYSFTITNNGFVLYHPDLRPQFFEMLKPGYSTVDVTKVEMLDNDLDLWEFEDSILEFRQKMIDRETDWGKMTMKFHFDDMKRVVVRNQSYYYGPLKDTPFSLAISLPDPYGYYRVVGQIENITSEDLTRYLSNENWRVHSEWNYCYCPADEEKEELLTPEECIRVCLMNNPINENMTNDVESPKYTIIDKDLLPSLIFDVKATADGFGQCASPELSNKHELQRIKMNGIATTFVATRSGLLRFKDHRSNEQKNSSTGKPFYELYKKGVEEKIYKRAVDFHSINSSAFVFEVPFDAASKQGSLVTGSHALFLGTGKKQTPVAVVGLQLYNSLFTQMFFNFTSKHMKSSRYKCSDDELDCYLLDNNGFVVVSEDEEHIGQFFGEIDYMMFHSMIEMGIYKKLQIHDYQAICLDVVVSSGPAAFLLTPLNHLISALSWMWSKFAMLLFHYSLYGVWSSDWVLASESLDYDFDSPLPNQTIPRPCIKEADLYEMQFTNNTEPIKGTLALCFPSRCHKEFVVHQVPFTNLAMLVVDATCRCDATSLSIEAREAIQNETQKCSRMREGLYRKRPLVCVPYHPDETEIHKCCSCLNCHAPFYLLIGVILLHLLWDYNV